MEDCYVNYDGREGIITKIDDAGQLFGTWGGLALIPSVDSFTVVTDGYTPLYYPEPMQVKWWSAKDGHYHGGIVYKHDLITYDGEVRLIDDIMQEGINEDVYWDNIIIELSWINLDKEILGDESRIG